jgi:hypothetical protein
MKFDNVTATKVRVMIESSRLNPMISEIVCINFRIDLFEHKCATQPEHHRCNKIWLIKILTINASW